MVDVEKKVFFARNLQELFYQKRTISSLEIIGACTYLKSLPEKSISTTSIPELKQINKHERFVEFGPGVTLSEILSLGTNHIPQVLYEALKKTANPFVRNIATIGGNICANGTKLSLYAPLLALDAQLELKSQTETKYVPLQKFKTIPDKFVLTNIRVPLNDWSISIYERLGQDNKITDNSAGFVFLAASEKSIISNIRIAFAGVFSFRCLSLENKLLGMRLPLNFKDIENYCQDSMQFFDEETKNISFDPILRTQFQKLIQYSLEQLT